MQRATSALRSSIQPSKTEGQRCHLHGIGWDLILVHAQQIAKTLPHIGIMLNSKREGQLWLHISEGEICSVFLCVSLCVSLLYVCQALGALVCVSPCPFWVHVGSILGPFWVHFGVHFGVHMGSIWSPFGVHLGSILGLFLGPFWVHLGPFWVHFGVHFGSILGPFWVHLGSKNRHLDENQYLHKNQ